MPDELDPQASEAPDPPLEARQPAASESGSAVAPVVDPHSTPAPVIDPHSTPVAAPEPVALPAEAAQVEAAPEPPPQPVPVPPVVAVTAQAAQTAVSTAKQATQQVAATVQQKAQKITVAPRKALYRGKRFMLVYGSAVGAATLLAMLARRHRYFPADIGITRLLQRPNSQLYDAVMDAVSELGWRWISVGARGSATTLMWAAGFRMESAFTLSTWSGDLLTMLIKGRVSRPRPTADLVRVLSNLKEASFPSGHVVHYVTFYGFLFYLVFTHLKQGWIRNALLSLLGGVILLVGPSRIYMGHHWPSDVGGAYLVGTLWLGVIIIAYLETKANYQMRSHPPFLVKRDGQLGQAVAVTAHGGE